jgi:hypothetical protein
MFSLWLEIAERMTDNSITLQDQGGAITAHSPQFKTKFGYFLVFHPEGDGASVSLPGDRSFISNRGDNEFWSQIKDNIPQLMKLVAGAIGKFILERNPGHLDCQRLFQVWDEFAVIMQGNTASRGQLTSDSLMRLVVSVVNRQSKQPYAQMGSKLVRKDSFRKDVQRFGQSHANMMRGQVDDHQRAMNNKRASVTKDRQDQLSRWNDADDVFNYASTPRQRSSEDMDSYANRLLRRTA